MKSEVQEKGSVTKTLGIKNRAEHLIKSLDCRTFEVEFEGIDGFTIKGSSRMSEVEVSIVQ